MRTIQASKNWAWSQEI